MRYRVVMLACCLLAVAGMVAMSGPVEKKSVRLQGDRSDPAGTGLRMKSIDPVKKLDPENFRCILVGDSQTTGASSNRIRTQTHRWDAPISGEQLSNSNTAAGFLVNNSTGGISNLAYSSVILDEGWPGGGPADFFASRGSHWLCGGDIQSPGSRIGRYRFRFGGTNIDAPWDTPWGIGTRLVSKIAIRTSPMCVPAIETRAERGGVTSSAAKTVHKLNNTWGVQIIEQIIPANLNASGDDVGVALHFPSGSIEQAGDVLQVLGAVIQQVDVFGRPVGGTMIGYQGRGGWRISDHLEKISIASRVALIEMIDADYVMIMLGHNQEEGGSIILQPSMEQLVSDWELAYAAAGRARPSFIFVVPWAIFFTSASSYLLQVESVFEDMAARNRKDIFINLLPRYDYLRPDVFDSLRYQLDGPHVHPGNVPTADHLAEDLFQMLFHP